MRRSTACLPALLCLVVAHQAWGDTMRCGDRLITNGEPMATVKSLCGAPTAVQHGVNIDETASGLGERAASQSRTVDTEVPVETWTYDRGPDKLMMSIRFVDGKVAAITTLHEYGH